MANALAIAAVTATLLDRLNEGMFNADLDPLGQFDVTALPPDRLVEDPPTNRLNLYPWKVTHNPALSNMDMPARSRDGTRISRNRLALDIHFILTATGQEGLNAPIIMGYGMQQMHETPVLSRKAVRASLGGTPSTVDATALLPGDYRMLAASDLADQIESVRITPAMTEDDELSKIWPAFNASLRLSALYRASVVLIEMKTPPRPTLPVRSVGLRLDPILRPRITAVHRQDGDRDSAARPQPVPIDGRLSIEGEGLASDHVRVRMGGATIVPDDVAGDPSSDALRPGAISLRLSRAAAGTLRAGVQSVVVEHLFDPSQSGPELREASPPAAVLVSPDVASLTSRAGRGGATGRFTGSILASLSHTVGKAQAARLLLNSAPGAATSQGFTVEAAARTTDGTELRFDVTDLPGGSWLWRVEIDGAPTPLSVDANGHYDGPLIQLQGAP